LMPSLSSKFVKVAEVPMVILPLNSSTEGNWNTPTMKRQKHQGNTSRRWSIFMWAQPSHASIMDTCHILTSVQEFIPANSVFNKQLLDLLKKIFVYDPKSRISAKEALKHPWFKESLVDDGTEAIRIREQRANVGPDPKRPRVWTFCYPHIIITAEPSCNEAYDSVKTGMIPLSMERL